MSDRRYHKNKSEQLLTQAEGMYNALNVSLEDGALLQIEQVNQYLRGIDVLVQMAQAHATLVLGLDD